MKTLRTIQRQIAFIAPEYLRLLKMDAPVCMTDHLRSLLDTLTHELTAARKDNA